MKRLKKIWRSIFTDFTVIIVPKTRKSTKQFKLNGIALWSIAIAASLSIIGLTIASVSLYFDKLDLTSEVKYLNVELLSSNQSTTALKDQNTVLVKENGNLSGSNKEVLDYLNNKIDAVNAAYGDAFNIVATFKDDNNSDITVPVSRSLDRASIDELMTYRNIDDKLAEMDTEEIKEQDALSQAIYSMKEESSSLISEIESELEYLDCLPDLPPVEGRLSSGFGYRRHPITGLRSFHYGIDITNNRGTPVQASGSGVVVFSGWRGTYGKVIIISHGYGYETVYAHNNQLYVSVGDTVEKGDVISAVGNTGNSTGPHLHFEIRLNGKAVNPLTYLRYDQ